MEPRKPYTKEFKLDTISLVLLDQGLMIAEAARSLRFRTLTCLLGGWVKESLADLVKIARCGNWTVKRE